MVHMNEWRAMTPGVGQNYLINSTGVTNTGYSETSQLLGTLLTGGLGIAVTVAAAKQNGGAASVKQANSAISKQAQATITSYSSDMTAAISNFTNKYSEFDVSISEDGTPSKSFGQIKGELENRSKTLQDSIEADKKENLAKYTNQKGVVIAVESAITNYNNIQTQLDSLKNSGKIDVPGETATAAEPNASDFDKYLSAEDKKAGKTGEDTQAYQDAMNANKFAADQYNKLAANQKAILERQGVKTLSDLTDKRKAEQDELKKLGEAKINGSMDVATYKDAMEAVDAQMIKLGTQADFNNAVKEIKDLHTAYTNALDIQAQENRVSESNNLMKNAKVDLKSAKRGGKKGLRGWIYDKTHKDKKDANVVQQKAVYNETKKGADNQKQVMQNLYEQFY